MKHYITLSVFTCTIFMLIACSANEANHNSTVLANKLLVSLSGNKPPDRFVFTSPSRANGYIFHTDAYNIEMMHTKQNDWTQMGGWHGSSDFQGMGIALSNPDSIHGIYIGYGINISSYSGKVGENQRAILKLDEKFFKNKYPKRVLKNGKIVGINQHLQKYGKENYVCDVSELRTPKRGIFEINYDCFKFNSNKTNYKEVSILLIYTKSPNLPAKYRHLAKQYTYADLKRRAKRMLDSLYIKDGW